MLPWGPRGGVCKRFIHLVFKDEWMSCTNSTTGSTQHDTQLVSSIFTQGPVYLYSMYSISVHQRKAIVGCLDARIIPRRVICYLNHNDPFRFLAKEKAQSKICAQARVPAAFVWSTPQEDPVVRMQDIPPSTNTPQPVFVTSKILQNPEVSFSRDMNHITKCCGIIVYVNPRYLARLRPLYSSHN